MPQFEQTEMFISQIFWLVAIFVLLYLLMTRVALPRIAAVLDERAARIAADLAKAETLRAETQTLIEAYEAALAKARAEAAQVLARANQEAAAEASRRQAEFSQRMAQELATAEQLIAGARSRALVEVRGIAREVAGAIGERLELGAIDRTELDRAVEAAVAARG